MEQLTTLSILSLFQTTKEERTSFVNDVVRRVESGEVNPLKIQLQLKCMEDIINQFTNIDPKKNKNVESAKTYRSALLSEAEKMDGKSFDFHNAKFEIKETGTKYHFEKTGDFELIGLEKGIEPFKQAIKERETFLKTIPSEGLELLNEETGEMVRVYPPYKTSTTSVSVTLK